ncbi:MAG: SET domain-containing protein, partial [Pyrinomonadaceae bacterium]
MRLKLAPGLAVGHSTINGRGCFATTFFRKGFKIAEYAGERISRREVARRVRTRRKLRICAINQYWSLDGSVGGNGTHYINHSCAPNSYMKVLRGHILFMALRDIRPGEEITLDYVSTYHADTKRCRCRSASC